MEKQNMICVSCPLGCDLEVEIRGEEIEVKGYRCKRGETYARNEILDPRRMVTSNVRVSNGDCPLVSVKTIVPLPKGLMGELIEALKQIRLEPPVQIGQVIIRNFQNTGIDIVATRAVGLDSSDQKHEPEHELKKVSEG